MSSENPAGNFDPLEHVSFPLPRRIVPPPMEITGSESPYAQTFQEPDRPEHWRVIQGSVSSMSVPDPSGSGIRHVSTVAPVPFATGTTLQWTPTGEHLQSYILQPSPNVEETVRRCSIELVKKQIAKEEEIVERCKKLRINSAIISDDGTMNRVVSVDGVNIVAVSNEGKYCIFYSDDSDLWICGYYTKNGSSWDLVGMQPPSYLEELRAELAELEGRGSSERSVQV